MKILHLPLWFPTKDDIQLGNFIQQQIKLTQIDHEIFTLTFLSLANCRKIEFDLNKSNSLTVVYPKSIFKLLTFFHFLRAANKAFHYLKNNYDFELIHCHIAGKNLWFAKHYFKNIPVVLSEHWSGYVNGNFKKLSFFQKKLLLKHINSCDAVVSVSPFLTTGLIDCGVNKPIVEIGNVIDVKKKINSSSSKEMHFLVVADLVDQIKNISGVINAISILNENHPTISLSIVGDGKDAASLKKMVNELKLVDKVLFLGRVDQQEVQRLILQSDCTIVNSNFETFSMIVLETIFTGNPVICTKCGGPEQFINKKNGILIEKNDVDSLAKAMVYLQQNRKNYSPLVVQDSISNRYSKDAIRMQLNELYSSILKD